VRPVGAHAGRDDDEAKKIARTIQRQERQPLILFVAKGGPNVCGPGCSEWIAAEGMIDKGAGERLKGFLAGLVRRDLPMFVSSPGGNLIAGMQIGASLRRYRMSVGVGRTIPEGCGRASRVDEACRRLMQSKPEHRSRLVVEGAKCSSACVTAIAGGSVRRIGRGAQLGIHAFRNIPEDQKIEQIYGYKRRYFLLMGVDPGIVDASAKISADSLHVMTRREIARFHVETGDSYESPWLFFGVSPQRYAIFKSFTPATSQSSTQPGTTVIRLACSAGASFVSVAVWREMSANESNAPPGTIRIGDGDTGFAIGVGASKDGTRFWQTATDFARTQQLTAGPKIDVVELFPAQGEALGSALALSTAGLADALKELNKHCQAPVAGVSGVGGTR
jgi:hypothetical protein